MLSDKVKQELIKLNEGERKSLIESLIKSIETYKELINDCQEYIGELTNELNRSSCEFEIKDLKDIIESEKQELTHFHNELNKVRAMLKFAKELQGGN